MTDNGFKILWIYSPVRVFEILEFKFIPVIIKIHEWSDSWVFEFAEEWSRSRQSYPTAR